MFGREDITFDRIKLQQSGEHFKDSQCFGFPNMSVAFLYYHFMLSLSSVRCNSQSNNDTSIFFSLSFIQGMYNNSANACTLACARWRVISRQECVARDATFHSDAGDSHLGVIIAFIVLQGWIYLHSWETPKVGVLTKLFFALKSFYQK